MDDFNDRVIPTRLGYIPNQMQPGKYILSGERGLLIPYT